HGAGHHVTAERAKQTRLARGDWAGLYDIAENRKGSGATCPANGFKAVTTTCRAAENACDRVESCDGSASCPADVFAKCPGQVAVVKTANGWADGRKSFPSELRQGASTMADGTTLETQVVKNTGTAVTFSTLLTADQHYQLCEQVFPSWNTTLSGTLFVPNSIVPPALPNPNVINLTVCTDFVAVSGGSKTPGATTTFTVDNTVPGGRALTIGFWKNWSSCKSGGGGQRPTLDQTLRAANGTGDTTDGRTTLPGIVASATSGSSWKFGPTHYLVLPGSTATPNAAPDSTNPIRL